MRHLLPRSLIGQMALLIGIALLIAQIANRSDDFTPLVGDRIHVGWASTDARVFSGQAEASG